MLSLSPGTMYELFILVRLCDLYIYFALAVAEFRSCQKATQWKRCNESHKDTLCEEK